MARTTASLPKDQGGFGVINFKEKADSFALQWLKRFFGPSEGKWKAFFIYFYMSAFDMQPRNALLSEQYRQQIKQLPAFYQTIHRVWRTLGGGVANGDVLSLNASSDVPLPLEQISSRNTYALLRSRNYKEPHCIQKYLPIYGQLHWSQTWSQLHICDLDRQIIDLNWQIAHSVLYTGARLAHSFGMRHIESLCFCRADDETLEHLFFECELARILVAWVYFNLYTINPTASRFTVEELLFGVLEARRRAIPTIIIYMLLVVKHTIWVARCDFRFRQKTPIISECLNKVIVKLKFILSLLFKQCKSSAQIRAFEREWLARGSLGHLEGQELVFSF